MISKRVLFMAAALLVVCSTMAMAQLTAVDSFQVNTLNIYAPGQLDIRAANPLADKFGIVHLDGYDKIDAYIASGWDSGAWDGTGIISTYCGSLGPQYGLGIWTGDEWVNLLGNPATFHGVAVTDADVLIQPGLIGDANGDGVLDGSDYSWIDAAWEGGYAGGPAHYCLGDFNHDGILDGSDYSWIDAVWGIVYPSAAAAGAPVPEPSTIIMLAMVALSGLLVYRRK